MKKIVAFLFCLLFLTGARAQQDSTYSYIYDCDSCGTFETVSFEPIELETEVDIFSEVLPDTSTSTLAQFSSVTLRKASSQSSVLNLNKTYMNIYPNPAKSNIFVNIESEINCSADIQICDLVGREILGFEINLHEKMNVFELPSAKLFSGNYIIRVFTSTNVLVKKFTIKK